MAEEDALESLVDHLRDIAREAGFDPETAIDWGKARNVLEATAGDLDLAAQLYWDDFLATRAAEAQQQQRHDEEPVVDDLPQQHGPQMIAAPPPPENNSRRRNVRRRLEEAFDQQVDTEAEEPNVDELLLPAVRRREEDPEAQVNGGVARMIAQAREAARRLEERVQDNEADDRQEQVAAMAARAAEAFLAARGEQGSELVSVSDDEAGGVWKVVGGLAAKLDDKDLLPKGDGDGSPARKRRKISEHPNDAEDDDAYLSDNDWLWESLVTRSSIPTCPPIDLLWGLSPTGNAANNEEGESASNVIADDDGEDEVTSDKSGIPRTWLSAGFSLSECGTGLAAKPPSEEDIAFFAWREQVAGNTNPRNHIPPPYHCRAVTAILSIVTALLYTGASAQTREASCSTSRRPFVELSKEERQREFEGRLADALSALLLIAAKASVARKRQALQRLKQSQDLADKQKWQKLERKLRLCPTSGWEQDSTTGEVRMPDGRDVNRNIQVATSYTNINDLRSYVLSNMRSFTSSGGCALLLETILRIHGKGAVTRMIRRSRRKTGFSDEAKSLVHCTCEERFKKKLEENPPSARAKKNMKETMDTTPRSHECTSIEILSLLLSGRVHSTLKDWSAEPLGVGLLSNKAGEVGMALTRPEKPVWILRGPTCYSVMWLNECQDLGDRFSSVDLPGSVAKLTHWNCWYRERSKTDFRLVAARPKWTPSTFLEESLTACFKPVAESKGVALIESLRRSKAESTEKRRATETVDPDLIFTEDEIERVNVHLEDQKFYPGQFQMWRYDMCEDPKENQDKKQPAENWVPFHRLTAREKLIVENKLGPKINTILWTRWPRARIHSFEPESPSPVV